MKNKSKKISVILCSLALLMTQNSFAARLGSAKNSGMQRSTTSQQSPTSSNNSSYQPGTTQPVGGAQGTPQRSGPGVGAVVAGAAAGAVGGYMLGRAMNSDKSASSQVARDAAPSSESHIPWGIIAILGMLLVIGLMIFRRKTEAQTANQLSVNAGQQPVANNFEIPNIRRDNAASYQTPAAQTAAAAVTPNMERMADGVEAQYFLRQAKGMFLHIQSMNTPENVSEVEKYLSPELYTELKQLISSNDYIADFSQLDCQLLDSSAENGKFIASVKFYGKVSESPTSPAVDFSEIWHFSKPAGTESAKWVVAGIQQTTKLN